MTTETIPTTAEAVKAALAAEKTRRKTVRSHVAYVGHEALAETLLDADEPEQTAAQIITALEVAVKSAPTAVSETPKTPEASAAPTLSTQEMLFAAGQADAEFLLGKKKAA